MLLEYDRFLGSARETPLITSEGDQDALPWGLKQSWSTTILTSLHCQNSSRYVIFALYLATTNCKHSRDDTTKPHKQYLMGKAKVQSPIASVLGSRKIILLLLTSLSLPDLVSWTVWASISLLVFYVDPARRYIRVLPHIVELSTDEE